MHELSGCISNIAISYASGKPLLTLEVNEDARTLERMCEALKGAEKLTIKIGKHTKKRSLDANAYFHVLVNAIARKVGAGDDEIKRKLVRDYGTLARHDNGDLIGAMLPAEVDIEKIYPYTRNYKTEYRGGKEFSCYLFYKRTRELDSAEMARLIEGTIWEAKKLGIETRSREEIESLLDSWGER